ncbi:MAG: hypothetical protein ACOYOD_11725 [Saprospiraceae bacterium]
METIIQPPSIRPVWYPWLLLLAAWGISPALSAQDPAPSAQLPQSSAWAPFTSVEGRFEVLTPAPMRARADSAQTPIGTLVYHTFICREGLDMTYLVSYCDYPAGSVHSDSLDLLREFFTATLEQALSGVEGGELVYAEDISILGFPGKSWRINAPAKRSVLRTRAFVAANRFYSLQTVMSKGQSLNPNSQRFMESFRIR